MQRYSPAADASVLSISTEISFNDGLLRTIPSCADSPSSKLYTDWLKNTVTAKYKIIEIQKVNCLCC